MYRIEFVVNRIGLNLGVYHLDDQDRYSAVGKLILVLDFYCRLYACCISFYPNIFPSNDCNHLWQNICLNKEGKLNEQKLQILLLVEKLGHAFLKFE